MSRPNVVMPDQAAGPTRALYNAIKRAVRGVPNIAAAPEGVLRIGELLGKGQLTTAEIEAVKLAVNEAYGYGYCLSAYSLLGKDVGLTEEEFISIFSKLLKLVHQTPLNFLAANTYETHPEPRAMKRAPRHEVEPRKEFRSYAV